MDADFLVFFAAACTNPSPWSILTAHYPIINNYIFP